MAKREAGDRQRFYGITLWRRVQVMVGWVIVCLILTGGAGKQGVPAGTRGAGASGREVTAQDFSIWFGAYFLPPPPNLTANILESLPDGKGKQEAVKKVYDEFGKNYQESAKEYFARIRDLESAFRKKPLAEADAKDAVNKAAEAQKKMLKTAQAFWEALRTTLGPNLFQKYHGELTRRSDERPPVPLPSLAVLISPLPQDLAFFLGQYLEIQPSQLERFRKQSGEKEIETAADSFIKETQKLLEDLGKAGAGDWSDLFKRAEKQVEAESALALLEINMWRAFNDALSADQVRNHWVVFFWEKERAFFLPLFLSPPPLVKR